MSLSYDVFTRAFLAKVTEFDFLKLEESASTAIIDGYMKAACAGFGKVCRYSLTKGELVLDSEREKALYRIVDFTSELSEQIGRAHV